MAASPRLDRGLTLEAFLKHSEIEEPPVQESISGGIAYSTSTQPPERETIVVFRPGKAVETLPPDGGIVDVPILTDFCFVVSDNSGGLQSRR